MISKQHSPLRPIGGERPGEVVNALSVTLAVLSPRTTPTSPDLSAPAGRKGDGESKAA